MSTHQEITNGRILGWLNAETEAQARVFADPEPEPYEPTLRAGTHTEAVSAFSWVMQGNQDLAKRCLSKLDEPELDRLMSAAAVLVALAGGVM